jgi:hypothetical protein
MSSTTLDTYANIVARALAAERSAIAERWLVRLHAVLDVAATEVFPSADLLDHIPALVDDIAAYLRAPEHEEIAANAAVIDKARELGTLRYEQKASVHQLLREYEILGEILEEFVAGAVIMFWGLGFLPAWILCGILKAAGALRIPREIELVGLDLAEYHGRYLDEDEVRQAEAAEARSAGLIRRPAPGE